MFSLPPPPQALVITADDFGFGVPTSRGIVISHQVGVVTATSLMVVTGEHASASVQLLADAPRLEVGLHLVMSGPPQHPLVAGRSSGLVDRHGAFHSLPILILKACSGQLNRKAVFDEICAQANRFRDLMGKPPAYVDGHHHAHQLPMVRQALIDAMDVGMLPKVSRLTAESPEVWRRVAGSRLRRFIMNRLGDRAAPLFRSSAVATNHVIFGMIHPAQLNDDANPWGAYLPHLPRQGVVEWFVHPGELDSTLSGRDTYIRERTRELEFLVQLSQHPDWPRWQAILTTKSRCAVVSG